MPTHKPYLEARLLGWRRRERNYLLTGLSGTSKVGLNWWKRTLNEKKTCCNKRKILYVCLSLPPVNTLSPRRITVCTKSQSWLKYDLFERLKYLFCLRRYTFKSCQLLYRMSSSLVNKYRVIRGSNKKSELVIPLITACSRRRGEPHTAYKISLETEKKPNHKTKSNMWRSPVIVLLAKQTSFKNLMQFPKFAGHPD